MLINLKVHMACYLLLSLLIFPTADLEYLYRVLGMNSFATIIYEFVM